MSRKYVLMLENDADDRYITQTTLAELGYDIPVRYEYYSHALPELIKHDVPGIILLAYNTSPENGLEVVKHFRSYPQFSHVPIVILIEELPARYIKQYYSAGANTVIKKPSSVELTRKKVKAFFEYWFNVAEL
ncbi:MAG: response regulator [Chitinophagaceae bacterium]|nr:response regulator [Chitinophagaceae bacterium]